MFVIFDTVQVYEVFNFLYSSAASDVYKRQTVFQAEVIAIREATKNFSAEIKPEQKYIKIFTDSQAALQALANNNFTSKIVKETCLELNKLKQQVIRLEIAWIKAHVGYKGNEEADEMARKAEEINDIQIHIADSWTTYKGEVWKNIYLSLIHI